MASNGSASNQSFNPKAEKRQSCCVHKSPVTIPHLFTRCLPGRKWRTRGLNRWAFGSPLSLGLCLADAGVSRSQKGTSTTSKQCFY